MIMIMILNNVNELRRNKDIYVVCAQVDLDVYDLLTPIHISAFFLH